MRANFKKYYFSLNGVEIDEEEIPNTASDMERLKEKWLMKYYYESCESWSIYFKAESKLNKTSSFIPKDVKRKPNKNKHEKKSC